MEQKETGRRKASFLATVRAVLWSFFGVRRKSAFEWDSAQLKPLHVIVAGVLLAVAFVLTLLLVVKVVVGSAH